MKDNDGDYDNGIEQDDAAKKQALQTADFSQLIRQHSSLSMQLV